MKTFTFTTRKKLDLSIFMLFRLETFNICFFFVSVFFVFWNHPRSFIMYSFKATFRNVMQMRSVCYAHKRI